MRAAGWPWVAASIVALRYVPEKRLLYLSQATSQIAYSDLNLSKDLVSAVSYSYRYQLGALKRNFPDATVPQ